ncbi:hypothetical protein GGX14DRAFT_583929 [Mycena pura]|uniref:Uncharacterized protein n=1 Tax=Mycena pura TaxID=153505 RepID=A0AAD7E6X7_9AGAR|nr:hypothetical protein GGX14DRAFT_583929 [Mycena pura]
MPPHAPACWHMSRPMLPLCALRGMEMLGVVVVLAGGVGADVAGGGEGTWLSAGKRAFLNGTLHPHSRPKHAWAGDGGSGCGGVGRSEERFHGRATRRIVLGLCAVLVTALCGLELLLVMGALGTPARGVVALSWCCVGRRRIVLLGVGPRLGRIKIPSGSSQ